MASVLVIGSGGREMAQALALANSEKVEKVICAPGNGGTAGLAKVSNIDIKDSDIGALVEFATEQGIGLVAVGPEAPLVAGVADAMAAAGIPCFGPTKAAAQLENSKAWMKEFFKRHSLPTARYETFTDFELAKAFVESIDYPVVVKASGLAGGKGVLIPENKEATIEALKTVMVDKVFGAAGDECVVEEMLVGPECSVLAFCDGVTAVCMPGAQDHKRALDGDLGLNTGGMGAYSRCPCLTPELEAATSDIVQRTVSALAAEGTPFVGVLFGGFMLTESGPQLLEYARSVRSLDPLS
jgi:phosphoribosylamine--glycine ligase/phosphoribosylformylglycinamidine cyclo-ligase